MTVSPGNGTASTSSSAAVSRTVRARTCTTDRPDSSSRGPLETRPRDGFSPTSPQSAAGMRMEPPPSPAPATGTMPEATAAADPPEEPPGPRSVFHGLRVGPYASGSVVATRPSSGVLVRPTKTNPARRRQVTWLPSLGCV